MQKVDRAMRQWLEFKVETKTLAGNYKQHPTLPYVLLVSTGLRDHCLPKPVDGPHLTATKERCLHFLGCKFLPSMKAKVATFLRPDFKEMMMLPEEEREEVCRRAVCCTTTPSIQRDKKMQFFFAQVKDKVRSLIGEEGTGGADPARDPDDPPSPPQVRGEARGGQVPPLPAAGCRATAASGEPGRAAAGRGEVSRYLAMAAAVPAELLVQHWKNLVSKT